MVKVVAVSIGAERGVKKSANKIELDFNGVIGDVHAGNWNRQVSIISTHHIEKFQELTECRATSAGEFAENILVESFKDIDVKVFDRFIIGDAELEVTQIGKPFHSEFRELGNYLMPRVGIFCRVIRPSTIKPNDEVIHIPKIFSAYVITLSDRASQGVYEDLSGPIVVEKLKTLFQSKNKRFHIESEIIPDNENILNEILDKALDNKTDVIITTGGTGVGPRDITVDVVSPKLDKEIPGIMEMIRMKYGSVKPNALLSRGIAGVKNNTLIYTLPGSVKGVSEYITEITKTLDHLFYMIYGIDSH
jgi:molybdenum cofactor synthesis domain-containing protein